MAAPAILPPRIVSALRKSLQAEQSAATTPEDDAEVRAAPVLEQVRRRVALIGPFDPDTVVPARLPLDLRNSVLRALAAESEDVSDGRRRRWMLRPDPRRTALRALRPREMRALLSEVRPSPSDRLGASLQALLRGTSVNIQGLSTADLHQVKLAGELAASVYPRAGADLRAVRGELGRRALEEALAAVMPDGLIGRDSELQALWNFVMKSEDEIGVPKALVVTGMGGSGKSTLIAAFVRALRAATPAVSVILLDFDRPMVTPEGVELTLELARQLGIQVPSIAEALGELRADSTRRIAVGLTENVEHLANVAQSSLARADLVSLSELSNIAGSGKILHRPLVVVLDTFEEVVAQGPARVVTVHSWLSSLASVGGFRRLRPIVTSRATRQDLAALDLGNLGEELPVKDLKAVDAAALLVARGVERTDARQLADRFGGNPLLLRLLADFRKHNPEVPIAELVRGRRRKKSTGDWRLAYVYDRILEHVPDEVGKLAHPGLVLRRVTASLISQVLAVPCGLGKVDATRAQELFDRLASHVWLVERRSGRQDEVYHRRDLRQLMLPQIEDEKPAQTKAIHRAAVRYYREAATTAAKLSDFSSAKEAGIEALYHKLMLRPKRTPRIPHEAAADFRIILGSDIEDLPLGVRASLKHGAEAPLTAEEIRALPRKDRVEATRTGINYYTDPVAAVNFAAESLGASWHARLGSAQAIQLLHATGDLDSVARSGSYLRKAVAKFQLESTIAAGGDVTESPLWLVSVFRLLLGGSKPIRARVSLPAANTADGLALLEARVLLESRSWPSSKRELFVRGTANDRLTRLSAGRPGSTIILRHAMLSGSVRAATVRLSKFPLFDPRVNRWFSRMFPDDTQFHGIDRKELKNLLSLFANLRKPSKGLTLRQIDDAIARWTDSSVVLSPGPRQALGILVRGINPEFQAPAAIALAEIVTNPSHARALAQAVWRVAPVRPVELHPGDLSKALMEGPRHWLTQVVDLVDRSGRLGRLLIEARKIAPRAPKLRTVAVAYAKWDALLWSSWRRM